MLKQVSAEEFLNQGIEGSRVKDVIPQVREVLISRYPDAVGVAFFQNMDMCSSQCGDWQVLPVGPSNTFKTVEDLTFPDGKQPHWLKDLPSQRQYAQCWCPAAELLEATKALPS